MEYFTDVPGGSAYLTDEPVLFLSNRLSGIRSVSVRCVAQPNSVPHIGSALNLIFAFTIARRIMDLYHIPAKVIFDFLDNSPADNILIRDIEYFHPLFLFETDIIRQFTGPICDLADRLSSYFDLPFFARRYTKMQQGQDFRKNIARLVNHWSSVKEILSFREDGARIRPLCTECYLGEKIGRRTQFLYDDHDFYALKSICPEHGEYLVRLNDTSNIIDMNTPLRSAVRMACLTQESQKDDNLDLYLNGTDWGLPWWEFALTPLLSLLGISTKDFCYLNAPLVTDNFGGKLSKNAYVPHDKFQVASKIWLDYSKLLVCIHEEGEINLFKFAIRCVSNSSLFFRNYSVEYLSKVLMID